MSSPKKISIIIPAYNCEKYIAQVIPAALSAASAYRNVSLLGGPTGFAEVIVVDDGSVDRTKEEITKFPTVKYFYQLNAGPAAARNLGALESEGEVLFFTDSDCLAHVDWIEKMLPYFENSQIAVVAGSYGVANPQSRLSRCIHREIRYRHQHLMPDFPVAFGSYNFAIRRSVFQEVGGFDTRYRQASGEDNDLSYKISSRGLKIYFAKDALVDHYHTEKVGKYLGEQYRHGFWRVKMYLDHPTMAKGDGYTFWKDMVEVGLVLAFYLGVILVFISFFFVGVIIAGGSLIFLIVINIYFSNKLGGEKGDILFFGDVMILRAFSRTNGFLSGILHFLSQKDITKTKIEKNIK